MTKSKGKRSAKSGKKRQKKAPKKVLKLVKKSKVRHKKPSKSQLNKQRAKEIQHAQELVLKKKIMEEQEKLWAEKLNLILTDRYTRQLFIRLAGENALEIVRNFNGESSDEDLAKKLQLKISDVRATLNKLHNYGLVQYSRQKDSETGWYSYSWILNKNRIEQWARAQQTPPMLATGMDHYFCPGCGPESMLPFPEATKAEFRCPQCDKGMEFLDEEKWHEIARR
ncbi:MAG TPA: hypothetical protein VJH24_03495 [Candidatus Bilamarchaeaceae archaeon]|nr:hypothetical protein [Candidatus Bilamarchaeaceae archaeon]